MYMKMHSLIQQVSHKTNRFWGLLVAFSNSQFFSSITKSKVLCKLSLRTEMKKKKVQKNLTFALCCYLWHFSFCYESWQMSSSQRRQCSPDEEMGFYLRQYSQLLQWWPVIQDVLTAGWAAPSRLPPRRWLGKARMLASTKCSYRCSSVP